MIFLAKSKRLTKKLFPDSLCADADLESRWKKKKIPKHGKVNWGFLTRVSPNDNIDLQTVLIASEIPIPLLWDDSGSLC